MFFILFGWGHISRKVLCSFLGKTQCSHCGNTVEFYAVRFRKWFTLFFIPVIPYNDAYWILCPICSYGKELAKTELVSLLDQIKVSEVKVG